MKFQRTPWSCGPAAIYNAASVLGVEADLYILEVATGCRQSDGTAEEGIKMGARSIGLYATEYSMGNERASYAWLVGCLEIGNPVILCVDNWEHWVTAVGRCGEKILIADPAQGLPHSEENGIWCVDRKQLLSRWYNPHESEGYYAIRVSK